MKLKTLTRQDVKDLADTNQVFAQGEEYFQSGAVHGFNISPDNSLTAKVRGMNGNYKVEIVEEDSELVVICGCPYDGEVCKHAVAVLLYLLDGRQNRIELETNATTTPVALAETLRAMSARDLADLIIKIADTDPNFRHALITNVPIAEPLLMSQPPNPQTVKLFKRRLDEFFQAVEEDDYYDDYYDADDEPDYAPLEQLIEEARLLHPTDQMEIFFHVLVAADEAETRTNLEVALPQVGRSLELYSAAARAANLDSAGRRRQIDQLMDGLPLGIVEFAEIMPVYRSVLEQLCTEPADYRYLIKQLLANPFKLAKDWAGSYYLRLGEDAAYLQLRAANLERESHYLELADYWQAHSNSARMVEVLEQGAARFAPKQIPSGPDDWELTPPYTENSILPRLAQYYREQHDDANLLRILMNTVQRYRLTMVLYHQIEAVAGRLLQWPEVKAQLLKLAAPDYDVLAQVYIYEQDWDAAIELARTSRFSDTVPVVVARGIAAHRPNEAIKIYDKLVYWYIEKANRNGYQQASQYAAAIKEIYLTHLNDQKSWLTYIGDIRQANVRRRALQEEFAGL